MDFNRLQLSPLEIKVNFGKLISKYKTLKDSKNPIISNTAKTILDHVDKYPILKNDFSSFEQIEKYEQEIEFLLQDLFHPALSNNEIKAISIPFSNHVFMKTERFKRIINNVPGDGFELELKNLKTRYWYIIASSIILKSCYGYELNFKRPFYYEIPDKNGITRYYKVLFNADFVDIIPKPNAPKITQTDYELLLDNFDNMELWKEKFPPYSYDFKGFIISNIFDVTEDQSISNVKTALIGEERRKVQKDLDNFNSVFRSLLGLENVKVGFSKYNQEFHRFEKLLGGGVDSYLLNKNKFLNCEDSLCGISFKTILKDKKFLAISDIDKFFNAKHKAPHIIQLYNQGIKSAILAPVANETEILGVLEIVSEKPKQLNSVNAQKLEDIMPFFVSSVERYKNEEQNLVEAIIQKECTSIHPSVHWRFAEEAYKYIEADLEGKEPIFNSISFDNIYPLYGQLDIKHSSEARNTATINDLNLQLQQLRHIFRMALETLKLPIYEQFLFKINEFISGLNEFFQVDSEQQINNFIKNEIHPILQHLKENSVFADDVNFYCDSLDSVTKSFYKYRKDYDQTIASVNKCMSAFLDQKQVEAQAMYPHYYERFKTDGVEHNMYIGESITQPTSFNPIYLYNLRLWQLQVMCEMENEYYQKQSEFKVKLDVASMILVFSQPLSISFRMDEKQFDVDGTYNARYEIVKKRVDKAYIKGTTERVTQKGKITIVYSQKEDEEEYLNYIKFLQFKRYLDNDVEILELQDLQAVSGLKAIRVSILYHKHKQDKEFYTYEDLMKEIY
jgi:hypothetical protein